MYMEEYGWHNTICKTDSRPRAVEVLTSEVLTAEQCPVSSSKTLPSYGKFPLPPPLSVFGEP